MSLHRSLTLKGGAKGHRNVLSREERIAKLEDEGRWSEPESVYGLPKVRNIKQAAARKAAKKKAAQEEVAEGAAEGAAEGTVEGEKT